jgi:hypothetical protein
MHMWGQDTYIEKSVCKTDISVQVLMCENVDWIHLVENIIRWQAFVERVCSNAVVNHAVRV